MRLPKFCLIRRLGNRNIYILRYPYPAWIAGTVYDPESGNYIIDMRIINPQDTRQLLDLALGV